MVQENRVAAACRDVLARGVPRAVQEDFEIAPSKDAFVKPHIQKVARGGGSLASVSGAIGAVCVCRRACCR